MRPDMFKVIVERPRLGVHKAPRVKLRHDSLPDRARVGMGRAAREQVGWTKSLNENLAPLRRYLWKQRGRPWNKVYSEICATLDASHTVKQHVRDHLKDLIVIRVVVGRSGKWLGCTPWDTPAPLEDCRQALYVDPRDGIIKETLRYRRRLGLSVVRHRREVPCSKDRIRLSATTELRRILGIWYRLRFECHSDAPPRKRVYDLLRRQMVWPGQRHAVQKDQLSKAQLIAYDLGNYG